MRPWTGLAAAVMLLAACSSTDSSSADRTPSLTPMPATTTAAALEYDDVAAYMRDHGVPFENVDASTDDALGQVCAAVDGQEMDPQFRQDVLATLDGGQLPPRKILRAVVDGCRATGWAADPPEPEISYESTCEADYPQTYVTGDGSENTRTGYRFIADVTVTNDGEVDALATVRVDWHLVGGGDVSLTKVVDPLPAGEQRTIGFTRPATLDEIQRMGAHQYGDGLCSAHVSAIG